MPGKSCVTQLLHVMELWTEFIDQGNPDDIIYFDFRKAFDSVPHVRLLLKLQTWYWGQIIEMDHRFFDGL